MACANRRSRHRARRGAVALVPVPLCHRAAAMTRAETVIVGGGPAGSATACGLAALGRDVVLIERTAKPHHKVCGEFLSVETQTQLQRLGVDPAALGAVPIEQVAVYSSSRSVTSAPPFRVGNRETGPARRRRCARRLAGRPEDASAAYARNPPRPRGPGGTLFP